MRKPINRSNPHAKPLKPISAMLHATSRTPSKQLTLRPRNIFIFPSRRGFLCLGTIVVIWLLGTNYQNNLVVGMAYLLAAILFLAIFETYKNLHQLTLELTNLHHNFLGSPAGICVAVRPAKGRVHYAVKLGFSRHQLVTLERVENSAQATLWWHTYSRGRSRPPQVRVWSRFPLRLFHAWSWYTCDGELLTYPTPLHQAQINNLHADNAGQVADDFAGLRDYVETDSPKHISWKHFARDNTLRTKLYHGHNQEPVWLSLDPRVDLETALSQLCYWVLAHTNDGQVFGLQLGATTLAPATGEAHRDQALALLATYEADSTPSPAPTCSHTHVEPA